MKKSFFSKLFISLSVLFALTSCDNFFSGALIQEELQELIEEANAPEVEIFISADANTGTVTPNGSVTHKVGKTFSVDFKESSNYQFQTWEVIDKSTSEKLEGVLSVVTPDEHETFVKVLSFSTNVVLHPVCIQRPEVLSYSPQYTDSGVSRDESISVTFNKNISKDNDLSKIVILCDGNSVKDHYKNPVINDNLLTIAVDRSNLIPVSGTKRITVKIPSDFFYEVDGKKIPLGTEVEWTFKINEKTTNNTEIKVSVEPEKGTVSPAEGKFNIGDTFTLKYEPAPGYKFYGWNILDAAEDKPISDSVLKLTDKNALSTDVTVLENAKTIIINPKSVLIPTATYYPELSLQGVTCTKSIVIRFNKKMDISNFIDYEQNKIKNITISSGAIDYLNVPEGEEPYFNLPTMSEDSKVLTITTNKNRRILSPADLVAFRDIIVTVKTAAVYDGMGNLTRAAMCDTVDNEPFEKDIEWTYRVNALTDITPQFLDLIVSTKTDSRSAISTLDYVRWNDSTYYQNHAGNSVYFTPKMISSNGLRNLKIKETLVTKVDGSPSGVECEPVYIDLSGLRETEENTYEITNPEKYTFRSQEDGLVKLELTLYDVLNYSGSTVIYAIKDTKITKPEVHAYNKPAFDQSLVGEWNYGESYPNLTCIKSVKIFTNNISVSASDLFSSVNRVYWCLSNEEDFWFKSPDKKYTTQYDSNNFIFYWGNDRKNYSYSSLDSDFGDVYYLSDTNEYTFTIPDFSQTPKIDTLKDVYYKVCCTDLYGNTAEVYESVITKKSNIIEKNVYTPRIRMNMDWINPYADYSSLGNEQYIKNGFINVYCTTDESGTSDMRLLSQILSGNSNIFAMEFINQTLNRNEGPYYLYFQGCCAVDSNELKNNYRTYGQILGPVKIDNNSSFGTTYLLEDSGKPFTFNWSVNKGERNSGFTVFNISLEQSVLDYYDYMRFYITPPSDKIRKTYAITHVNEKYEVETSFLKDRTDIRFGIEAYKDDIGVGVSVTPSDYESFYNFDVEAPVLGSNFKPYPDGFTLEHWEPYDSKSEIKRYENGLNCVKFYFVPNSWANLTDAKLHFSTDLLTGVTSFNNFFNGNNLHSNSGQVSYIKAELPEVENNSLICGYVEDSEGNFTYNYLGYYKKEKLDKVITVDYVNSKIYFPKITVSDEYQNYGSSQYFDETQNKWIDKTTNYKMTDNGGGLYSLAIPATEKFVRVYNMERKVIDGNNYTDNEDGLKVTRPYYFYAKAGMHTGNVVQGMNGYTLMLYGDEPCLVELVYSTIKDYGDKADDWDYNVPPSQKLGAKLYYNQETYVADTSKLPPEAKYYTSIFHFADGSSIAAPSKQIN